MLKTIDLSSVSKPITEQANKQVVEQTFKTTSQNITHILQEEIIHSLLNNNKYFSQVIHHLQEEHFTDYGPKLVFKHIKDYYTNYKRVPTLKELLLSFKDSPSKEKNAVKETIKVLKDPEINYDFLIELTEKFIKMSLFAEAVILGADALGSHNEDLMSKSFSIAEDAVKISLDEDLGTFVEDIDSVYDDFKEKPGVKLNIPSFDNMIGSGFTPKTLHAVMAASGVGKSAAMVAMAVEILKQGKDVAVISLEMSESEFYKRIYANLYDIDIQSISTVDKLVLEQKQKSLSGIGKLVVKEYPAGGLTPLGLDGYLSKLENEAGFTDPFVFVDYLGLMASDRLKNSDNSYAYYGSISEELRAIAQKRNIVIYTALQLNRSAIGNLEADQSTLSESMKILMTLDSAFIIAQTPEMKELGEMKINWVKNRMSGKTWSFDIKFDYRKFRFVDDYNINGENVTSTETPESLKIDNLMGF